MASCEDLRSWSCADDNLSAAAPVSDDGVKAFAEAYRAQPISHRNHERFLAVLDEFQARKRAEGKLWDVVSGDVV
jgi:hypothetical protein